MALIKKCDVQSYFAQRKRKQVPLFRPTSQPDATGFSNEEVGAARLESQRPTRNTHSVPCASVVTKLASEAGAGSTEAMGKTTSRNAQP